MVVTVLVVADGVVSGIERGCVMSGVKISDDWVTVAEPEDSVVSRVDVGISVGVSLLVLLGTDCSSCIVTGSSVTLMDGTNGWLVSVAGIEAVVVSSSVKAGVVEVAGVVSLAPANLCRSQQDIQMA